MSRAELLSALHALEPALRDLAAAVEDNTAGRGGAGAGSLTDSANGSVDSAGAPIDAPQAGGPGIGSIFAAARSHPVLSGLATIASGAITSGIGQGLVSRERGGDFAAGASSGFNAFLAKVPVLGEFTGASAEERVKQGVRSRVSGPIAELRARGINVPKSTEAFLQRHILRQETLRQSSLQRSELMLEQRFQRGVSGIPGRAGAESAEEQIRRQINETMRNRNSPANGTERFR